MIRTTAAAIFAVGMLLLSGDAMSAGAAAVGTSTRPEQADVEALLGQAALPFPGEDGNAAASVSDRILDGFQAAPGHLALPDGSVVYWGFKFQEANLQSVVFYDASGRLRLAAVVDDIARIDRSEPTLEQYRTKQKDAGLGEPSVLLFVRDQQSLAALLPVFKRWIQADLLGFNADCGERELAGACALAANIAVPVTAYRVAGSGAQATLSAISIPDVAASDVPLKDFVQ